MSQTKRMHMCDASGTMFPADEKMFVIAVPGSDEFLTVADTTIARVPKDKRRQTKTSLRESRRLDFYEALHSTPLKKGDFCFSIAIDDCKVLEGVYERLSVLV